MSKQLLVFTLSLFVCTSVWAQYESARADNLTIPSPVLVQNYMNKHSVATSYNSSYDLQLQMNTFAADCSTIGGGPTYSNLITTSVPGLYIEEMVFDDHYAFFCGQFKGMGAIGYFDINEFQSGYTLNLHWHTYDGILDFIKLVAYPNGTTYKVVAIGRQKESGLLITNSVVVEDGDIFSTTSTNLTFAILPPNSTDNRKEYAWDLVKMGDIIYFFNDKKYDVVLSNQQSDSALCQQKQCCE